MSSVDWREPGGVPSVGPWPTVGSSVRGELNQLSNEDVTEKERAMYLYCVSASGAGNRNMKLLRNYDNIYVYGGSDGNIGGA